MVKRAVPLAGKAAAVELDTPEPLSGDDRIKAKISDVIKSRAMQRPILQAGVRHEPPVGRGPQPMVLDRHPPLRNPVGETSAPAADHDSDLSVSDWDTGDAELLGNDVEVDALSYVPPAPEARKVVQHNTRKATSPSRQAQAEAQPALEFETRRAAYEHPPLNLLSSPTTIERHHLSDEALEENARMLENVLDDYGVKGEIVSVRPGPVVTMYELEPAPGLKASRVIGLSDDIARSMSALSARVSTVPGRSVIGIELPNANREKGRAARDSVVARLW